MLLLHTHVLLWWVLNSVRMSREQLRLLRNAARNGEATAISAISLPEMAQLSYCGLAEFIQGVDTVFENAADQPGAEDASPDYRDCPGGNAAVAGFARSSRLPHCCDGAEPEKRIRSNAGPLSLAGHRSEFRNLNRGSRPPYQLSFIKDAEETISGEGRPLRIIPPPYSG